MQYPFQPGPLQVHNDTPMEQFDVTISYGVEEISLNDGANFRMAASDWGNKQQTLRRIEVESPYYDGTYPVHSTKGNVNENISVYVYGFSQNHVTENLLLLEELFNQDTYTITVRMDDHLETWNCWPADYAVERSHVFMHNGMAVFKAVVPRHPKVSYEAIL